ncbi:diguanylate cyclase [Desulfobacter hydrogenophilus]|uniref:Diguanylate cyclase n=1 Tax=Desulfobacter hydrogenophilus TaxID=2291 RepID=A0A328FFW9_9BACT|nr:HD domain-containing protein [Desulfobacter hydrogenophilus]NDY71728.1 HD domain-containing protein [Desulfobacter hydrogenophilus]QBH13236.1 HD domain-containing protein [Desulfobacter hydrogenophilus]RAM02342.1 diguanylate cyclase [Desulfobacter hydrogenophilus]
MSVDVDQKMLEMMQAKKVFLKKYKRAQQLFSDLVKSQKRLFNIDSQEKKNGEVSDKINIKESVHAIDEIMEMLVETDRLILNSTKDYFSTDDYLFQHSFGVCYIGTIVLKRFNEIFSRYIKKMLTAKFKENLKHCQQEDMAPFFYYPPEAVRTISMGYLIHDMGKIMVPDSLLNKKSGLNRMELRQIQKHAGGYGTLFLKMNGIYDVYVENIIKYHHAAIYPNEKKAYPVYQSPSDLPPYVKICKLADIYSAMTLKRSYGEAVNPTKVVNTIFQDYSGRDPILQLILYSFVKEIGTCPEGSILTLKNGQSVYVINSEGPEVIIFTDQDGNTIETADKIINLSSPDSKNQNLFIDGQHRPKTPIEMFDRLPKYLKEFHSE